MRRQNPPPRRRRLGLSDAAPRSPLAPRMPPRPRQKFSDAPARRGRPHLGLAWRRPRAANASAKAMPELPRRSFSRPGGGEATSTHTHGRCAPEYASLARHMCSLRPCATSRVPCTDCLSRAAPSLVFLPCASATSVFCCRSPLSVTSPSLARCTTTLTRLHNCGCWQHVAGCLLCASLRRTPHLLAVGLWIVDRSCSCALGQPAGRCAHLAEVHSDMCSTPAPMPFV